MPVRTEHEKLVAYERAVDAAVLLDGIVQKIPERRADLKDQLRRASASVPLNLAEGAGEFSPPEKARSYRLARRSAAECSAILDLVARITDPRPDLDEARALLAELASMLTGMVKAVERRPK